MLVTRIQRKTPKLSVIIRHVSIEITEERKGILKDFSQIPGPTSLPFLGTLFSHFPFIGKYNGNDVNSFFKLHKDFGDMVKIKMPMFNTVLLFHPDLITRVFAQSGRMPGRPGMEPLAKYRRSRPDVYSNTGLIVEQGSEWRELRNKVQKQILGVDTMAVYAEPMSKVTNDFIERMKQCRKGNMEIEDFHNEVMKWGLESVAAVTLSRRFGCLGKSLTKESEPQKVIDSVLTSFKALDKLEQSLGLWSLLDTPTYRKLVKAQTYFDSVLTKYLQETVKDIGQNSTDANNILHSILKKNDMDLKKVTAVMIDAFLGGIDTTSVSANFLLYELALNPDKQEMMYKEVIKVIPDKNALITSEQLDKLTYLKACIKESMRMHPPTIGTARLFDYDIELDGYLIPKNTRLGLISLITCKNAKYFPNPTEFLPERWIKHVVGRENLPPQFSFLPFGYGARMCVGLRIAEQEIRILATKILQNFRLEYHGEPIRQRMGTVLVPDKPFRLKFFPRD